MRNLMVPKSKCSHIRNERLRQPECRLPEHARRSHLECQGAFRWSLLLTSPTPYSHTNRPREERLQKCTKLLIFVRHVSC